MKGKILSVLLLALIFSSCSTPYKFPDSHFKKSWHFYSGAGKKTLPASEVAHIMLFQGNSTIENIKYGGIGIGLLKVNNLDLQSKESLEILLTRITGNMTDTIALLQGEHTLEFIVTKYVPAGSGAGIGSDFKTGEPIFGTRYFYRKYKKTITKKIEVLKGKRYLAYPTPSGDNVDVIDFPPKIDSRYSMHFYLTH